MKQVIFGTSLAATLALLAAVAPAAADSTDLSAARRNDAYAVKNARCKAQADKMRFGIHFMKRNRWIKNCIATS